MYQNTKDILRQFLRDDRGVISIEFALIFPIFFGIFLMIFESGMISLRYVMLERGVDLAVREIRIGRTQDPGRNELRERICEYALIIPDCERQLDLEMTRNDPENWVDVDPRAKCVDRGNINDDNVALDATSNNQLMVLRACVRIDPFLPTSILGKAIVEAGDGDTASGGSIALVSTAAFVVEPFKAE